MIRKLRIKLILVSMCSLMAVLGLILGGINFLYYREVVSDSDDTLELGLSSKVCKFFFTPLSAA